VRSINFAITSSNAPPELVYSLLNLAEFMEHEDMPLPIEHRTLGEYAMKIHAYAKALHYKELELFSETTPALVETLIGINQELQQQDATCGMLMTTKETYGASKHEKWYERLGRWGEALEAYERKSEEDPDNLHLQSGKMRCLHALEEWDALASQVEKYWEYADGDERYEIAAMAATAAWYRNNWEDMEEYTGSLRSDSPDLSFYRAIRAVHRNQFQAANLHIADARDILDSELTTFVSESYGRSYK
jgi:serine/threonine-protein kinase mTOR